MSAMSRRAPLHQGRLPSSPRSNVPRGMLDAPLGHSACQALRQVIYTRQFSLFRSRLQICQPMRASAEVRPRTKEAPATVSSRLKSPEQVCTATWSPRLFPQSSTTQMFDASTTAVPRATPAQRSIVVPGGRLQHLSESISPWLSL